MALVMGAAIVRESRVLAARRTSPPDLAGGWELPGGKVEEGEEPAAAVVREIAEELGCTIEVTGMLEGETTIRDDLSLRVAVAGLAAGEPAPVQDHDAVRWLGPEELDEVAWLAPDVPFLGQVREVLLDGDGVEGGNVGGAVRVGNTIRRGTGPWTPAVHALLRYLDGVDMPGVPQVLGADARGREILTYLPGEIVDVDRDLLSEARLVSLVEWARQLHQHTVGFGHPGPWRYPPVDRSTVIAHNDLAPYNVCFTGDRVAGVFDWDLAAPSTPLMELGLLAWTCVPLFREVGARLAARRVRMIADTYGGVTPFELLDAAEWRLRHSATVIRGWIETCAPGAEALAAAGEPARTEERLDAWLRRRPAVEKELT